MATRPARTHRSTAFADLAAAQRDQGGDHRATSFTATVEWITDARDVLGIPCVADRLSLSGDRTLIRAQPEPDPDPDPALGATESVGRARYLRP
jgi:hypothetical protein